MTQQIQLLSNKIEFLEREVQRQAIVIDSLNPVRIMKTDEILELMGNIKINSLSRKYADLRKFGLRRKGREYYWKQSDFEEWLEE